MHNVRQPSLHDAHGRQLRAFKHRLKLPACQWRFSGVRVWGLMRAATHAGSMSTASAMLTVDARMRIIVVGGAMKAEAAVVRVNMLL